MKNSIYARTPKGIANTNLGYHNISHYVFDCNFDEDEIDLDNLLFEVNHNGEITITKYTGDNDSIVIPSTINGRKVTTIGSDAFAESCIVDITFPKHLEVISSCAFISCRNLRTIFTPDSLTDIEFLAFNGCEELETVVLNEGLKTIGDCAFQMCLALTDIDIPSTVTHLGDSAFQDSGLKFADLSSSKIKYIGEDTFGNTMLSFIKLPNTLEEIGLYAFRECSLKEITLPKSLITIGSEAFVNCCELRRIITKQESNLKNIEDDAFSGCDNLSVVNLPDGVKIGYNALPGLKIAEASVTRP